jgi:hypothetical protein
MRLDALRELVSRPADTNTIDRLTAARILGVTFWECQYRSQALLIGHCCPRATSIALAIPRASSSSVV